MLAVMMIGEVATQAGVNVQTLRYHERRGLLAATGLLLLLLAVLGAGCRVRGERRPFESIGPDGESLRAAFNDDVNKVRVIALVAPT